MCANSHVVAGSVELLLVSGMFQFEDPRACRLLCRLADTVDSRDGAKNQRELLSNLRGIVAVLYQILTG